MRVTRHLHIEAVGEGVQRVARPPVCHHEAFKAPVAPQHVLQQVGVLATELAVDLVVGAHHAGDAGFDGSFKRRQVEFMQGAFVDSGVDGEAILFLVVGGEMFDGGHHAVLLDAFNLGGNDGAGQQRIFAKGFEIAAGVGHAYQIDHGRQQHLLIARYSFEAQHFAIAFGHGRIEAGSECYRGRQRGGALGGADAGRPIGQAQRRNPEARHTRQIAGAVEADGWLRVLAAVQQRQLFIQRHLAQQDIHIGGTHAGRPPQASAEGKGD